MDEIIHHLAVFISGLWKIHVFGEGNYTNLQKNIHETTEYLEVFLSNLLLNENNEIHNRNLHISGTLTDEKVDIGELKVDIESEKVDIQNKKVYIESGAVD